MGRNTKTSLLVRVAGIALAASLIGTAGAQTPPTNSTAELQLALNKSRIITTDRPFTELSVGSSAIADVVALSRTSFYVLGKTVGSTNVIVRDREQVVGVYDVSIGYDVDSLKRKVFEVSPSEPVEIRAAHDSIVLSGSVGDASSATAIAALAERYATGKVTNMMSVTGSQQVMLEVKFAEIQRSALKDIGTQLEVTDTDGDPTFGAITLDGLNPLNYLAAAVTFVEAGEFQLDLAFDMLEQKGLVRTLAEPNMVALSGDTAKFLAGGEFPIPVAQTSDATGGTVNSAITVEFKEFGVGLAFTPTVTGKDAINLELAAEVSAIDPSVSFTLGDISVPGLKVRRTNTTVELRDGQSFAIAGLIQDDLTNQMRSVPWIGDLPIIGALARSEGFERRQTELVVLITARLVKPVSNKQLAAPTDFVVPPGELEFFLFGKTEDTKSAGASGGIDGAYGYVQP